MSIKAWAFLISRNRYLDYRTVVAPDFICQAGVSKLLAKVADGDLTQPGSAFVRKVQGSDAGDFTIIFRVIEATERDINPEGGNQILKDSFGREIYLLEGIVYQKLGKLTVSNANLEQVHERLKINYSKFWHDSTPSPAIPSEAFLLDTDEISTLKLEELKPFQVKSKVSLLLNIPTKRKVTSITFSPDGQTIAIKSYNYLVEIATLSKPECPESIDKGLPLLPELDFDSDRSVAFSPNGEFLASSLIKLGDYNCIKLWFTKHLHLEKVFQGHSQFQKGRIHAIAFSPDSKLIASASQDNTIKLWVVDTEKELSTLPHPNPVNTLAISPDNRVLASGDMKGNIKLWDLKTQKPINNILIEKKLDLIKSIAFSPDGKTLASGGASQGNYVDANYLYIWDVITGKVLHTLSGHGDAVNSIAYSPNSEILVSGGKDKKIKLWDVTLGKEIDSISEQHSEEITSVAFSPNGQFFASGSKDKTVKVWRY
ncbi:hypothetical protein F7734_17735 [Scytonema sp. UIC 10036]|uniref:WD40 repeat domain-containing protein n=1 Tax=Scytonema sp. UIC 10036 TaxID=2304196 RepID=UPI0012DA47B3|nr:WD40 repeat domain-containing protein [Scytonema sp. UIC 10036]MUG94129.1 hypothetical protein [Scytonema sp. UIC 10036]